MRQGDPLSPYLFVIAMEVLTKLMNKEEQVSKQSKLCTNYSKLQITHLCFVDDLLMFSSANEQSIAIIVKVLEQFQKLSSLTATTQRIPTFYAGVSQEVKRQISSMMHFKESELPIRYLGVPLIARKLSALDCKALLERIRA